MSKIKSKRQLRADRQRIENQAYAEREAERLKANALRLKSLVGGFSIEGTVTGRVSASKSNESAKPSPGCVLNLKHYVRETREIKSLITMDVGFTRTELRVAKRMSAEMEERERIAQIEISKKRKRVAVVAHKSAYQYLSDDMDLTLIGRK
jgi:hypothetical protein